MFGCGAVAQWVLSGGSHGTFLTVNLAFGFAATLGILVCGQVSGEDNLYCFITLSNLVRIVSDVCYRKGLITAVTESQRPHL